MVSWPIRGDRGTRTDWSLHNHVGNLILMSEIESKLAETELIALHRRSMPNRTLMAGRCGCFHCLGTFVADTVTQWVDDGQTALCPVRGIDSVLPDFGLDIPVLEQMHRRRFEQTVRLTQAEWDRTVATNTLPG